MNAFQSVAPKGTTTVSPALRLQKGDILAGNGKVIRKKTLDNRTSPVISVPMSEDERMVERIKRHYDDRWEPGRSSLHRRF